MTNPFPSLSSIPALSTDLVTRSIASATDGLSASTRRAYHSHIYRYLDWADLSHVQGVPALHVLPGGNSVCAGSAGTGITFSRESVKGYLRALELSGSSAQVRNQALAALKKLAYECAELGWFDSQSAAQIERIRTKKTLGRKTGRWLTPAQLRALLESCDRTTPHGRRDRLIIGLMAGCGLRRSEVCALSQAQIVERDGVCLIENVQGKGGRVRTIRAPRWVSELIVELRTENKKNREIENK